MNQEPLNTPKPNKARAALRLVSTKDMSRDEWLDVRKRGIGGSDAAAAVGISPYKSPLELWMEKTGRDGDMPKPDPHDEDSPVFWGNILEPIVAELYAKRTGNKVRRVRSILQHPDNDKAFMLANLDYAVSGSLEVQILECKTAGEWGSKHWRDGVPDYIQCQVQHQLAVTGKQVADVAVLLCGQKLEIFRVERDEEVIERLIELERHFWWHVENDIPPATDGSESSAKALNYLFPRETLDTINFTDDAELSGKFAELVSVRNDIESLTEYEDTLKQAIQQQMGDYGKAVFATGHVTWKRSKDSITLDTATLLKDQPELLARYPQTKAGSRRFLIRALPTPDSTLH